MDYDVFPIPLLDENKNLPDRDVILARFRTALYERLDRGAMRTKVANSVHLSEVAAEDTSEQEMDDSASLLSAMDDHSTNAAQESPDLLSGFDD